MTGSHILVQAVWNSLCSPGCPQTAVTLLPQPLMYWDYRLLPPHLAQLGSLYSVWLTHLLPVMISLYNMRKLQEIFLDKPGLEL